MLLQPILPVQRRRKAKKSPDGQPARSRTGFTGEVTGHAHSTHVAPTGATVAAEAEIAIDRTQHAVAVVRTSAGVPAVGAATTAATSLLPARPAGSAAPVTTTSSVVTVAPTTPRSSSHHDSHLSACFDRHPAHLLPRRRTLLVAAVVAVPLAVLAVRFRTDVTAKLTAVPAPRWHWLALCVVASIGFYVANGVALRAASGIRLPLSKVTAVQFAAAAANRIVPAGIGAIAVNLRFLEKKGMSRATGLAAVASTRAATAIVHLAGIAFVFSTMQGSGIGEAVSRPLSSGLDKLGSSAFWAGFGGVVLVVTAVALHPRTRAKTRPFLAGARGHFSALLHSPGRSTALMLSLAATKLAQVAALAGAVWAFGGPVSVAAIAAVFLVGSAVAGAAPTAGSVGAIEPALVVGLHAAGGETAAMMAAVLVFRLISYWMPVVPGTVALAALRRRGDL